MSKDEIISTFESMTLSQKNTLLLTLAREHPSLFIDGVVLCLPHEDTCAYERLCQLVNSYCEIEFPTEEQSEEFLDDIVELVSVEEDPADWWKTA